MLKDLIKMANKFDSLGLTKEANTIDTLIKKIANQNLTIDSFELNYHIGNCDNLYFEYEYSFSGTFNQIKFNVNGRSVSSQPSLEISEIKSSNFLVEDIVTDLNKFIKDNTNYQIKVDINEFISALKPFEAYFIDKYNESYSEIERQEKICRDEDDERERTRQLTDKELLFSLIAHLDPNVDFTLSKDALNEIITSKSLRLNLLDKEHQDFMLSQTSASSRRYINQY